MSTQLDSITHELFNHNVIEILDGGDATDDLYDALVDKANSTIDEFGWEAVFESWKNYMYKSCHTVEDALNFATLFEIYG